MWGHETNQRGSKFEDFIQDYDLQLHNAGRDFTFECMTGKSVIDVTLSRNLKLKIEDWKVCKAYNHADHNTASRICAIQQPDPLGADEYIL